MSQFLRTTQWDQLNMSVSRRYCDIAQRINRLTSSFSQGSWDTEARALRPWQQPWKANWWLASDSVTTQSDLKANLSLKSRQCH